MNFCISRPNTWTTKISCFFRRGVTVSPLHGFDGTDAFMTQELPLLKSLSLDSNEFLLLPQWIDKMDKLKTFTFSNNKCKMLPNNFHLMDKNLTELR